MTIWILAILLTAIACAALLFAGSGKLATAGASAADATQAHFRAQLAAIDADASAGRLGGAEAVAARRNWRAKSSVSRARRPRRPRQVGVDWWWA